MINYFQASDDARIAYRNSGTGPALLCLSGLSRNSTDFDYVLPHIDGMNVIRMDYRGRGESEWTGPETYTIAREAQDALELLDHLGIEQAAILGTSRGGIIAMALAATAKQRLTGVFLNDIGPEISEQGLENIKDYIGLRPKEKTFSQATEMRASLSGGFRNVPLKRWDEEVRKHYRQTDTGLELSYDPALAEVFSTANQPEPIDLWPLFDMFDGLPLAGLRGENSDLLTQETFEEMQRHCEDMIAGVVPDRGHVPFLDEPVSLAVLNKFLKAIR